MTDTGPSTEPGPDAVASGPLVSIVTPAKNAAKFLPETIASVQAQTWTNWEWLIVDDGSTDETADLIRKAAEGDPRIRLLRIENSAGLAAKARNLGLSEARGELLALLDADDLWFPEKLEAQVSYLLNHPEADGVCTWYELIGSPGRLARESRVMRSSPVCERAEIRSGTPFQTSTFCFRRTIYDQIGGMDEDLRLKSGQDSEYFIRIVCRYRIHRIRKFLTRYRLSDLEGSLSTSHMSEENARGWRILEVLMEKKVLTPREQREWRSFLYYEQARDNLFIREAPFRGALLRSVLSGRPPFRAVLILLLCFLPADVLRPMLLALQRGVGGSG